MILADTSAVIALIDADDRHHRSLRKAFESDPGAWVLPWAILPEVDYLLSTHVGARAQDAFLTDLAVGTFSVEWGNEEDLSYAHRLYVRHKGLRMGLVDAIVIAIAERRRPAAIATLDLRHFAAFPIRGNPKLFPRDMS